MDEWLKFLIGAALVSYMTNTWLTIVWKVFGNGRFK
jgi:hypothetical protein